MTEGRQIVLCKGSGMFLNVSSISMVTNRFGDFSKCLIVSTILSDDDVKRVADEAEKLWRKFAHHPQTARCLAFLLVLGMLCKKIAKNYDRSVAEVDDSKAGKDFKAFQEMLKSDPVLRVTSSSSSSPPASSKCLNKP
jgi:hypothetical protein